jgi:hypothetical protein
VHEQRHCKTGGEKKKQQKESNALRKKNFYGKKVIKTYMETRICEQAAVNANCVFKTTENQRVSFFFSFFLLCSIVTINALGLNITRKVF